MKPESTYNIMLNYGVFKSKCIEEKCDLWVVETWQFPNPIKGDEYTTSTVTLPYPVKILNGAAVLMASAVASLAIFELF